MEKTEVSKQYQDECLLCKQIASSPVLPKKPWTAQSMFIAGLSGAVVVGSVAAMVPFVAPALRKTCLPYLPATPTQMSNVMKALKGRTGTILDIGSGDGRIVIEASRHGFMGHGVELNYWLVLYSRYNAWKQGQRQSTKFHKKNLWKTDFSKYDNIIIFGVDTMMMDLEQKFEKEIRPASYVLASRFPLPNWTPVKIIGEGLDTVWVYKHPAHQDSGCVRDSYDPDSVQRSKSSEGVKL